ncbi:unnamed protein product [Rangifer tarandus platyrhynchus]|uniref:Uncharacterized protein n=1 Tax=Rangifer tarandus platyrhynchus TaxID=3082113 RepID=A0AC59ZZ08_RANTA
MDHRESGEEAGNPEREWGPQPQMRSGSPICSLLAFKDNLGAPSQQIAPLENFGSCLLLAAQQRAYGPGTHSSCKQ